MFEHFPRHAQLTLLLALDLSVLPQILPDDLHFEPIHIFLESVVKDLLFDSHNMFSSIGLVSSFLDDSFGLVDVFVLLKDVSLVVLDLGADVLRLDLAVLLKKLVVELGE